MIPMSSTRRGLPLTNSSIERIFPKLTPTQLSRIAARGHIRLMEGGEVLYEPLGEQETKKRN
jgi:hypothetical protein